MTYSLTLDQEDFKKVKTFETLPSNIATTIHEMSDIGEDNGVYMDEITVRFGSEDVYEAVKSSLD